MTTDREHSNFASNKEAPASPDALLLELGRIYAEQRGVWDKGESDTPEADARLAACDDLFRRIARTPAATLAGLVLKAQIAARNLTVRTDAEAELEYYLDDVGIGSDSMGISVIRDLLAVGARMDEAQAPFESDEALAAVDFEPLDTASLPIRPEDWQPHQIATRLASRTLEMSKAQLLDFARADGSVGTLLDSHEDLSGAASALRNIADTLDAAAERVLVVSAARAVAEEQA